MGKIADFIKGVALPEQKKRQALTLDAEFEDALANAQKSDARILQLEAEVNPLKREVEALKEKVAQLTSSAKTALTFNQATGTHVDPSTGTHYCTRCLSDTKRSPLKNETHGWRCMVCKAFFQDPDRPQPLIESWQPADPGMGM